jgi:hypothetical protein
VLRNPYDWLNLLDSVPALRLGVDRVLLHPPTLLKDNIPFHSARSRLAQSYVRTDAQPGLRDACLVMRQSQVPATLAATPCRPTPFARRKRTLNPQKPGRDPAPSDLALRSMPAPEQVTGSKEKRHCLDVISVLGASKLARQAPGKSQWLLKSKEVLNAR